MKTLKNHTILYDEVCPMCNLYTKAFVQSGMLDKEGRLPYHELPENYCIDRSRAVDEIALVNRETGAVHYGVDSLMMIIGTSLPFLKPLFRNRVFVWLIRRFYRFISFNRRVIMPPANAQPGTDPSFHKGYRIAYIVFAWLVTAFILHHYSRLMVGLVPAGGFYRELLVCGGQLIWQGVVISQTNPGRAWNYLGTMMTVSLAGALALLPALLAGHFTGAHPYIFTGWFLVVAGLMLLEHIRRVNILKLNKGLSVSWVLYRVSLLFIII